MAIKAAGEVRKWALLIGINKYVHFGARYQLRGCVNDVEAMTAILRDSFGFPVDDPKRTTILRDDEATREGILAALDRLADMVGANDIVVIQYSGHGSQMTDREDDEPDGLDETIVPCDSGRNPEPNRDITDDEIYVRLLRLTEKTPCVTLLFDCCHSGTISRDPFGANSRWVEPDLRPAEELPPSPIAPDVRAEIRDGRRDIGASGWLPLGKRYVLIAGCRDEESSYEYEGAGVGGAVTQGALTYFLCQELVKAGPGATYRDVFEPASQRVTAAKPYQHPQMEGARDRELFGVHDIEPMRFVPVRGRNRNTVTLGAGAAQGVTVGSEWAAFEPGARQADEGRRLGLVKIVTVSVVTAEATVSEEREANAVRTGGRALEVARAPGDLRLVLDVQVPPEFAAAKIGLEALIEASPLLRLPQLGEVPEARAYCIAPRAEVRAGDPVSQLGAVTQPVWAVVEDGVLLMPTKTLGEKAALVENLEREVRYRSAIGIANPDLNSPLRGNVGFRLLRLDRDGVWGPAEPEDESGQVVFEEGDRIAFAIDNRHTAAIYVSVLDFGLSRAIGLIHPVEGACEQLVAGRGIRVGVRDGEETTLYVPESFPFLPAQDPRAPVGGMETFKLFATSHEADFSPLIQEGHRRLDGLRPRGADSPLYQLLNMALTGQGTREATRPVRVPPHDEWTTVERTFFLRRKAL